VTGWGQAGETLVFQSEASKAPHVVVFPEDRALDGVHLVVHGVGILHESGVFRVLFYVTLGQLRSGHGP